jgi:hypothetical protein
MLVRLRDVPAIVRTFVLFCIGVVFFRAASFGDAIIIGKRIAAMSNGSAPAPEGAALIPLAALAVLILDLLARKRRIEAIEATQLPARLGSVAYPAEAVHESLTTKMRPTTAGIVLGVLIVGIVLFSGGAPKPFIYFQL